MLDRIYEFDKEGHTIGRVSTHHDPAWAETHCRDSGVRLDGGKDV